MALHLEPTLIRMAAYIKKQWILSSDSTIVKNSEGSQYVESDQWDFEETIGDKIRNGNSYRRILEPYRCEPCASDIDEDGDNEDVGEDENAGRMFTTHW